MVKEKNLFLWDQSRSAIPENGSKCGRLFGNIKASSQRKYAIWYSTEASAAETFVGLLTR
jgi:hypothetical protein